MTIPVLTSSTLSGIPHGFFGRQGGVSTGDFASLNVSEAVGDAPDTAAENRRLVAATLGFAPDRLSVARQVHSADVVTVTEPISYATRPDADGLVTNVPGLLLGTLTADCAPILFADIEAGVIGAAHAGWKGAINGVAEATVRAMEALGARRSAIAAVIGPSISAASYEVGPQFAADVLARHPDATPFIITPPGGREHFDLPGFLHSRLRAFGLGTVVDLGVCTYANPQAWFSHRRATHQGTLTGRQIALIGLKPVS
jgi:polyphenol oxidase